MKMCLINRLKSSYFVFYSFFLFHWSENGRRERKTQTPKREMKWKERKWKKRNEENQNNNNNKKKKELDWTVLATNKLRNHCRMKPFICLLCVLVPFFTLCDSALFPNLKSKLLSKLKRFSWASVVATNPSLSFVFFSSLFVSEISFMCSCVLFSPFPLRNRFSFEDRVMLTSNLEGVQLNYPAILALEVSSGSQFFTLQLEKNTQLFQKDYKVCFLCPIILRIFSY